MMPNFSRPGEKLTVYKKRVLDTKSNSFCGAKWFNATTWLGSGTTASCHHPPAHKIPLEEVLADPSAIHNTKHKKLMRKMMQMGERPSECEYCWKIEDIGRDNVSDRVFKSIIYSEEELEKAYSADWKDNTSLRTFEIAFDRTCNLACSYCNASFSTAWARDIKQNGPYQNLVSDGAGAFEQDGSWADPFGKDDTNPYVDAFWKWWNNGLSDTLRELRITGGEPLMSPETWKLLDWFEQQDSEIAFAINTNLIAKDETIDRLIEKTKKIKNFSLYTSCETTASHAEYIRDGFNYETWRKNLIRILNEGDVSGLNIMMTINSLCLFNITEFMDDIYSIKEMRNSRTPTMSLNLLRFPSFQSPLAMPDHIKNHCREKLQTWYNQVKDKPLWHDFERASIERLIDYLEIVDAPHRRTSNRITLWRDYKTFYNQYDIRRNKNLIATFPEILKDWYESLPVTLLKQKTDLINGDSTKQYINDEDLLRLAKEEGWILSPDSSNISDPLGKYD
jgi:organic radical activating enzyme